MSDTLTTKTPFEDGASGGSSVEAAEPRLGDSIPESKPSIRRHPLVDLGHAQVGHGIPAPVIAEAGVNHNGDVDRALQMIDVAAEAGADFVKFQAFRADDLVTENAKLAQYQKRAVAADSQHAMLEALELDRQAFAKLKQRCDDVGAGFLATPFGAEDLRMLIDIGVSAIKIASTDLDNWPLLDACAATGLVVILSTGASLKHEVDATVDRMRQLGCGDRLVLMHCVSAYPAQWSQLNLRRIGSLRQKHNLPVGFSDHCTSTSSGAVAVAAGACILEKHFTLDRTLPGPDHCSSLTPRQFARYVKRIRTIEAALGDGCLDMQTIEADVHLCARKSLVARCDIEPGTVICREVLSAKRPGGGISPSRIQDVLGTTASARITANELIQWNMLAS